MKIHTIDLTVNLLLLLVVLTHVTICSFEFTGPSIVKLLQTNTHVCDFETPLKGSNHQLWLISNFPLKLDLLLAQGLQL